VTKAKGTPARSTEAAFTLTREFDAPCDLVFKAWSDAEHLQHWWGPNGSKVRISELDFRPDGVFHYCFTSAGSKEIWGKFVYHDISNPHSFTYTNSFSDEQGNLVPPPIPDWPAEVFNTVTFSENNGVTRITLTAAPCNAAETEIEVFQSSHPMLHQGFSSTLDHLERYLEKF
jgi:uncharacterized protein YndB with AHSA1/START domain